jgi:hypothetical protein
VNAERLHVIAKALNDELEQTEAPSLLSELVAALRQSVDDPSQPAHQQNVSSLRQRLDEALSSAPSNSFSPAWREALQELGVADLVGEALEQRIRAIFERNEITPSAAADELAPLVERLQSLQTAVTEVLDSFAFFDIGAEELAPGEFELGFLVPRAAVDEELQELGQEFIKLKRILGPFLELSMGTRPDVHVRSIASSGFQVFLHSAPATALLLATALERLISSYEKVMNIRLAYQQLREAGASNEALDGVAQDADRKMGDDIAELVGDLLAKAEGLDSGRANELRKELTDSLNALANRIDRGYGVEVRAGDFPESDEEEPRDPEEEERRLEAEKVHEMQQKLSFMNVTGKPILQLPEPQDEEAE